MIYFFDFATWRCLLIGFIALSTFACITEHPLVPNELDKAETILVGSGDYKFHALDAQSGTKRWEFVADQLITVTPTVNNGTVYTGSDHKIYAIDATTGTKKWDFATGPRPSNHYMPVAGNGNVYALGDNRQILYALDAVTGAKKWNVTSKSFTTNGGWYGSPLADNGTLYIGGTDTTFYALDAQTGITRWKFRAGSGFYGKPAIANGIVYAGCYDGKLYALDATTGAKKWEVTVSGYVQFPRIVNETIYITNWIGLFALDLATGVQKWQFVPAMSNDYTGSTGLIAIDKGIVYGGFVPLDWNDGFMYAIDAATGAKKWDMWPWPGGFIVTTNTAIITDGTMYTGSRDGTLRSIDAQTKTTNWSYTVDKYISSPLCIVTKQGVVTSSY